MSNKKERLTVAQWVLERNLAWIAAAEVKVGIVVAIDTAMLGGIAAALSASNPAASSWWIYLLTLIAVGALGIAIICAAMSIMPRVSGPARSLLFFGRIAEMDSSEFRNQFSQVSDDELLEDLANQIHRNAQIAKTKFRWVRNSMGWSFLSIIPWFVAITVLVKK